MEYQEEVSDVRMLNEKFGEDLVTWDTQVVTSTAQMKNYPVKYIIKVLENNIYIVVYDRTLKERMREMYEGTNECTSKM